MKLGRLLIFFFLIVTLHIYASMLSVSSTNNNGDYTYSLTAGDEAYWFGGTSDRLHIEFPTLGAYDVIVPPGWSAVMSSNIVACTYTDTTPFVLYTNECEFVVKSEYSEGTVYDGNTPEFPAGKISGDIYTTNKTLYTYTPDSPFNVVGYESFSFIGPVPEPCIGILLVFLALLMNIRRSLIKNLTVVLCIICVYSTYAHKIDMAITPTNDVDHVSLRWEAIPASTYNVYTTPNLTTGTWIKTNPSGIVTSNVLGSYDFIVSNNVGFFRLDKEDTAPPVLQELRPANRAIAVVSNATVSFKLVDETCVDTDSIKLSVGKWNNLTTASSLLIYTNNVLTFTPTNILGAAGTTITNTITVSDTIGHTLSNYTWRFQLALDPVVTNAFLSLSPPPGLQPEPNGMLRSLPNVQPAPTAEELHIISVTPNTVVFSYTDTPPYITKGTLLVSFDASYPFYRRVLTHMHDDIALEIIAWTKDIPITDLLKQGSISSVDLTSADPAMTLMMGEGSLNLLHVEFGDDISGTVFYEDAGLSLHLRTGDWSFTGDIDVAWDIESGELKALDTSATGKLSLNLTPEALFNNAVSGAGSYPLIKPVRKIFGGMVGELPVWVEVIMELNAGYEYSAEVSGSAFTTVSAGEELTFNVRLRENRWTYGAEESGMIFEADPITWQLEGIANTKFYIQPKLTVLAYSLAGLWADIKPYVEFDQWYQSNPLEYERILNFGLSSTLGIESRIWYGWWGDKPSWQLFEKKWMVWSDAYPDNSEAPRFISTLNDRTAYESVTITLSAYAVGDPPPKYQWFFHGSEISGAQSPEYTIYTANKGYEGEYSIQAWNRVGTVEQSCYMTVEEYDENVPDDVVYIPGGSFNMGDTFNEGGSEELPVHSVFISSFYMDKYEVSNEKVRQVMQWAYDNGKITVRTLKVYNNEGNQQELLDMDNDYCQISYANGTFAVDSGKETYPCVEISWYGALAFCKYKNETEGKQQTINLAEWSIDWSKNGYRLPTEAEWEKAARGGAAGHRFPWSDTDTISQSRANYCSYWEGTSPYYPYDVNPTMGYHPDYYSTTFPFTSPVGSFAPNKYGLYDMAGNLDEWCWDRYDSSYYSTSPESNPRGPASGINGLLRSGSWDSRANNLRCARRMRSITLEGGRIIGFRCVRNDD